ncbi:MAG: hypothetical protein QOC95_1268, partial [Thermoleophilaceae bacterium]|nr:hypothetical protein [Thermoleophilaceae bacterium]
AARFVRGLAPVFGALHVFLPQLNPILSYWNFDQDRIAHFIGGNGAAGFHYNVAPQPGGLPQYALAQFGDNGAESISLKTTRPPGERANSYLAPNAYNRGAALGIPSGEQFDCRPSGGEVKNASDDGQTQVMPCFVQPRSLYDNRQFPHLDPGKVRLKPSPRGTTAGTQSNDPNR